MTDRERFLQGFLTFIVVVVLPLMFYLKKRRVTNRQFVPYFFTIYVLWYLPFAPIHEGCHYVVGRLTGMHAASYQFMPHFWRGDFVNGYIKWSDGMTWQIALSCAAPYAVDGLIVLLGFVLFRKGCTYGPFLGALLLTETFLRSVFDVLVNYSAGALLGAGDFRYLLGVYPPVAVHLGAWVVILLGAGGAMREIRKATRESLSA